MKAFILTLIFSCVALADNQPAPDAYKQIPHKMACDAYSEFSESTTVIAKLKIVTDFSGDPLVTVTSSEKLFNFKIGQKNALGQDYSNDKDVICTYTYFKSGAVFANSYLGFKYACNDEGRAPTGLDRFSSFAYSVLSPIHELCLHAGYHDTMPYCVKLKNCKE